MALQTWLLYLVAVVGLALTPGPNSLLALTHGALHGHRRALFTVSGGAVGFALLIGLSMLGIGTLLQTSADALTLLKWIGGAYLVWLGFQLWRAPPMQLTAVAEGGRTSGATMFRQGFLSAVSNPKALLFYGAFLPQFIDPRRGLLEQFAVMALTFCVIEFVLEYLLARMAQLVRPRLEHAGRRFNRCCGGLFGLMGAALPMTR